ncbi:MAG: DUF167 domain-containing protein [Chlamydiota bacterium]
MVLQKKEGIVIEIKAQPGARREEITSWKEGILYVKIKENPEKGEANEALCIFLAEFFDILKRDILLIQGKTSRRKKIFCKGLTVERFLETIRQKNIHCN